MGVIKALWPVDLTIMPATSACLSMEVPFDSRWLGMIYDQLWQLTRWYNYERDGERTGKLAADGFLSYFDTIKINPGGCPDVDPLDHSWEEDRTWPISHEAFPFQHLITEKNKSGNLNNYFPVRPEVKLFCSRQYLSDHYLRIFCSLQQDAGFTDRYGAAWRDARLVTVGGGGNTYTHAHWLDCMEHHQYLSGLDIYSVSLRNIGPLRYIEITSTDPFVFAVVAQNPLICIPA